jgi:hypothetical protein
MNCFIEFFDFYVKSRIPAVWDLSLPANWDLHGHFGVKWRAARQNRVPWDEWFFIRKSNEGHCSAIRSLWVLATRCSRLLARFRLIPMIITQSSIAFSRRLVQVCAWWSFPDLPVRCCKNCVIDRGSWTLSVIKMRIESNCNLNKKSQSTGTLLFELLKPEQNARAAFPIRPIRALDESCGWSGVAKYIPDVAELIPLRHYRGGLHFSQTSFS